VTERMAITPDGDLRPVAEFSEQDKWWCDCAEMRRPHVHSPNWGGKGGAVVVTIPVDLETGKSVDP
jgi:hypothetical protein